MHRIEIIFCWVLLLCLPVCSSQPGELAGDYPYDWVQFCAENWLQDVYVDVWIPKECDPNQPPPDLRYICNWEKVTFGAFIDYQMFVDPNGNPDCIYWKHVAKERLHPDHRHMILCLVLHWRPVCGCITRELAE